MTLGRLPEVYDFLPQASSFVLPIRKAFVYKSILTERTMVLIMINRTQEIRDIREAVVLQDCSVPRWQFFHSLYA